MCESVLLRLNMREIKQDLGEGRVWEQDVKQLQYTLFRERLSPDGMGEAMSRQSDDESSVLSQLARLL
jgi:hypothetical protein